MSDLVRVSFSLEQRLSDQLEDLVARSDYQNRSEFIRDLIRDRLVADEWEDEDEALGVITLVFNHHQRQLSDKLTDVQHEHHEEVLAATHVHLTRELCAEMIMVRGKPSVIRHLANHLKQQKGVLHANLSIGSTGVRLA